MLREHLQGEHPTADLLERFLQNRMEPAERRTVVRHLIQGCPGCAATTREIWALGDPFGPSELSEDTAWGDADSPEGPFFLAPEDLAGVPSPRGAGEPLPEPLERVERTEAAELLAALEAFPRTARLIQIRADRRYRTLGFCLRLTEGSRAAVSAPAVALELGEMAVAVSERLDPRVYGTPAVHSAQIQAWAWYGEARRRAGDLEGAERSIAMAAFLLEGGLENLGLGAEVLRCQAALHAEFGEWAEAHRLLDQAVAVYDSLRDDRLRGRVLLQKGEICRVAGDHAAAIDRFQEGAALLAAPAALQAEDREALAAALYRLLWLLVDAGRGEEAAAAAGRLRLLWEAAEDQAGLARLRRLEGRTEELAGRPEAAEAVLWEARQACLDEDLGIEAALAIFDLALLFLRQRRLDDFQRLAEEVPPHFKARGIGPGEATALSLLREHCENPEPRLGLLFETGRYIASALRPPKRAVRQAPAPASQAAAG